jgi:hypothetical protein
VASSACDRDRVDWSWRIFVVVAKEGKAEKIAK